MFVHISQKANLLCILLLLVVTGCSSPEQKLLDQASDFAKSKNYADAISTLRTVPIESKEWADADKKIKEYTIEAILPETRQAANEVLDQLLALRSRLGVGLSYRDYTDQLGELKVDLDRFQRHSNSTLHPAYMSLSNAFTEYSLAKLTWQCYIDYGGSDNFYPVDACGGKVMIENYGVQPTMITQPEIYLNDALNAIWNKAGKYSDESQKAFETLKTPN